MTREQWLEKAVKGLKAGVFKQANLTNVPPLRVSVGFPSRGARGKRVVTGQCHGTSSSADKVAQVFIHPVQADPVEVLSTLTHEMIHVIDDCKHAHNRKEFTRPAAALGFTKPWKSTPMGPELREKLEALAVKLGEYPHAQLTLKPGKTQTARLRLWTCEGCGLKLRVARDKLNLMCLDCEEVIVRG
jgi:hypothetical protein